MKSWSSLLLIVCLGTIGTMPAPQSGGISGKLIWWWNNSFNSASLDYLYNSFREKVYEPMMTGLLADIQKLKQGQVVAADIGYGSLAAGIIALIGMLYLAMIIKLTNKANKGFQIKNRTKYR